MTAQPCPVCGGTGWKSVGGEAGRTATVVRCDCQAQASTAEKLRGAHIPPRYEHCNFHGYGTGHDNPAYEGSLQQARLVAERFAREFPAHGDFGLLFMGPSGVGKTHLAVAIIRSLAERGFAPLFYDFRELLKKIQDSYNPVSQATELQVLGPVLEAEILVLDDLGAAKPSAWVLDTVGHILNTRYNEKRTTLITTNYFDVATATGPSRRTEDTLADRIGERMLSRLYEMCRFVKIESEDFRRSHQSRLIP